MPAAMLKNRLEWINALLMAVGDLVIVIAVYMLGFWLRHSLLAGLFSRTLGRPLDFRLSALHYLVAGVVMGVVTIIVMHAFGVYRRNWGLDQIEELAGILRSTFTAVVITFALSFAVRELNFSRFVLLFSFPASSLCLAVWHGVFREMTRKAASSRGLPPELRYTVAARSLSNSRGTSAAGAPSRRSFAASSARRAGSANPRSRRTGRTTSAPICATGR